MVDLMKMQAMRLCLFHFHARCTRGTGRFSSNLQRGRHGKLLYNILLYDVGYNNNCVSERSWEARSCGFDKLLVFPCHKLWSAPPAPAQVLEMLIK